MVDPEVVIAEGDTNNDEEMGESGGATGIETNAQEEEPQRAGLEDIEPTIPERTTFLDFLKSPIVQLVIGRGENATTLSAHQALLVQAPLFEQMCAQFGDNDQRRINLADDDPAATASVLEYLYKSDYFPNLSSGTTIEYDPAAPSPDDEGVALLRHARIYTLAQRFGLPALSALAHKKIHLTQSTAKGEIAYARFVYKETSTNDEAIRKPVAAFWASRSYILRHEAEQDFKSMCLEFPQFGFDVLNLVLDAQEKRSHRAEAQTSGGASGRKRQRGT